MAGRSSRNNPERFGHAAGGVPAIAGAMSGLHSRAVQSVLELEAERRVGRVAAEPELQADVVLELVARAHRDLSEDRGPEAVVVLRAHVPELAEGAEGLQAELEPRVAA